MREGRRGQGRVLQVLQNEDLCPARNRPLHRARPLRIQVRPQLPEPGERGADARADDVLRPDAEVRRGAHQISAAAVHLRRGQERGLLRRDEGLRAVLRRQGRPLRLGPCPIYALPETHKRHIGIFNTEAQRHGEISK